MTNPRLEKIQKVLDRRQPDLTVLTDQMHKSQNIAAVIRTCDAVGVNKIHITVPQAGYRQHHGTAKGSTKLVDVERHEEVGAAITQLRTQGHSIVAAHFSDKAIDYRTYDYTQPTVLVLGAEKEGISDTAAEMADAHIMIPMYGMVESFNVSVAAGIILNEAAHQRAQKDMYATCKIDQAAYTRAEFKWLFPRLAKFCDDKRVPYPALDEQGDLVDPAQWYAKFKDARVP